MVSKSGLFSIYSFPYVLLHPHKNFHVGKEFTNFLLFWFEFGIMMYMLTHIF
jgi:hypothetical protein